MRLPVLLAAIALCAWGQPAVPWTVARRSARFEVYSQAGDQAARAALVWFEELRAFLVSAGLNPDGPAGGAARVRVIGFRSAKEYQPYRLHPGSEAYYVGTESREYIVMPALGAGQFGMAAHEYAHAVLDGVGLRLPVWMSEGLAEFFSTIRIGDRGCTIGGDLPGRTRELQRGGWISLARLLEATGAGASASELFYAESWILTDMLARSPEYAARFSVLVGTLASGASGERALSTVYGKSLDAIERDARAWAGKRRAAPIRPVGVAPRGDPVEVSEVSPRAARALMADLLLANGWLDRAEEAYRALEKEDPADADVPAALGAIALRRGDREGARREWRRAIGLGVTDAVLCYRFAVLASAAELPADEIRPALERALALRPDLDDARYYLGLAEKNAGRYESALSDLRAIRHVAPERAYAYWIAMADTLIELGRREDAKEAANEAMARATTPEERAHAATLAYVASTDVTVRLTRDAAGETRMETARVPHDTADWNPFILPEDQIRHVSGNLREVDCGGTVTRFLLDTAAGPQALAVPDPSRMLVRNGPGEFTCGPQSATAVKVDYAVTRSADGKADGVIRGIEFR
ncbi:MAG TPA: tetratricopeptide repeat protein [Bryobacteraceae bacterium]|nr:tetratricopeptide repeat protein [Bryobacteraceae bacterium]